MNSDPAEKDRRWHALTRQARADVPPSLDVETTLRALRQARPAPDPATAGWLVELAALLGPRAWVAGSAAAAALMVAGWFLQDTVQKDLPWIELATPVEHVEEAL